MKCETHILTDTINLYVAKGHGSGSVAQGNSAKVVVEFQFEAVLGKTQRTEF